MDAEDRQLVEGYLRGERETLAVVDGWLAAAAWPFLRRLPNEREDVLQEVRLEVLRLLREGRFRGESRLKTYLWRVAGHTCIDALRRRRRRPQDEPADEPVETAAPDPSPLDLTLQEERQRALLRLLEGVPAACRELWQAILAGASYQDIATRTGVSEGTLRVRAHRCRKLALERVVPGNEPPVPRAQASEGASGGLPRRD
jgi:RNA polymerase sigma-70 factor (ECF subfamily)